MLFDIEYQIEAIVQDGAAQGTISNIDALNLRLENQVWQFLLYNKSFFLCNI